MDTASRDYDAFEKATIITNPTILAEQRVYKEMQRARKEHFENAKSFKDNVPRHHLENWALKDVVYDELIGNEEDSLTMGCENKGRKQSRTLSKDHVCTQTYVEDSDLYALYPELSDILDEFKLVVKAMKTHLKKEQFGEIHRLLQGHVIGPYAACEDRQQTRLMAYHMAKLGFAKAASAYYAHVMAIEKVKSFSSGPPDKMPRMYDPNSDGFSLLRLLREAIWKLCGGSQKLAYKFGQAGFLRIMTEDLLDLKPFIKKETDEMVKFAILSALGILCNCAKGESNKKYYHEMNAVERVLPFFHSADPGIKMAAVLTLTYIVDEAKHPQLLTDETVINYLTTVLREATNSPTRTKCGYSAMDMIKGLTMLAVNDLNKAVIMQKAEVVSCLINLLQAGDPYEKDAAATAVWTLAFDDNNKQMFLSDIQLMDLLEKQLKSSNRDEKASAQGAVWVLKGQDVFIAAAKKGVPPPAAKDMIMLSYNWADQRVAVLIRDSLKKANFDVWIEMDHLEAAMPEAKIAAIDSASVVIMCVSSKYKQSPISRTEARYASELQKHLMPVSVQRDYRPDGWLQRILTGGAEIYDMGSTGAFEINIPKLVQDLNGLIGSKIK